MKKRKFKAFFAAILGVVAVAGVAGCQSFPDTSYKVEVIGGKGSGYYNSGADVTISATPTEDQVFKGWLENDSNSTFSDKLEYKFKANKDVKYKAVYQDKYSQLTIVGGGYETKTGLSSTKVEVGSQVTIKVDDNSTNQSFEKFIVNGKDVTSNPYTFTVEPGQIEVVTKFTGVNVSYVYVENGKINGADESITAVEFQNGEECTIEYITPETQYSYFRYWYYIKDGKEEILSRDTTFKFTVEETMFIYAQTEPCYTIEVLNGDIECNDYYDIDNAADKSVALVFEGSAVQIEYTGEDTTSNGFKYWYFINEDGVKQILSYDKTCSFNPTGDMEIKPEIGDSTEYNVTVTGGVIEGVEGTNVDLMNGREITVIANTGGGEIFQGWKNGEKNVDGTDVILSRSPYYTFVVEEDVNLSASYSNKLMHDENANFDDLMIYVLNSNSGAFQYITFFSGTTNGMHAAYRTEGIKLYLYTSPDDDRERYVGTITTTGKYVDKNTVIQNVYYMNQLHDSYTVTTNNYLFEIQNADGRIVKVLSQNWANTVLGGNILFEGAYGNSFSTGMRDAFGSNSSTTKYYVAAQLLAQTGYEDSDISISCRRPLVLKDSDRTNNTIPKDEITVTPTQKYTITKGVSDNKGNISFSATESLPGEKITITVTPNAGNVLYKLTASDNSLTLTNNNNGTYSFTMPRNNVTITAQFKAEGSFVDGATVNVVGGTVDGKASTEVERGESVTIKAAAGAAGELFQGWTDGTTKADGTPNIISFSPEFTYKTTETSITLTGSYAKKLVQPDGLNINDTFRYGGGVNYLEFIRFSSVSAGGGAKNGGLFDVEHVDYVRLYVYANVDADRDDWVASIDVYWDNTGWGTDNNAENIEKNIFVITSKDGLKTEEVVWGTKWSSGAEIYFSNGGNNDFAPALAKVIADYNETGNYFFAYQLIATADSGFANSDISSCSRIAFTQSGNKSNTPVA